jgi:uncharacterized iron-regulated protein
MRSWGLCLSVLLMQSICRSTCPPLSKEIDFEAKSCVASAYTLALRVGQVIWSELAIKFEAADFIQPGLTNFVGSSANDRRADEKFFRVTNYAYSAA